MTPTRQGSLPLFRLFGIQVSLHWAWFLVAAYELTTRSGRYSSLLWNGLEYVGLFLIVLMHEFGHALACRQVGGRAQDIVLWPLGGVAYVAPPQRPSAVLWSIAAGPLVNVALLPVFGALLWLAGSLGWAAAAPDLVGLVRALAVVNLVLLLFNLLPIYPLDGGQILRALIWFLLGRARSLLVASALGFVGVGALVLVALWLRSPWIGLIAAFVLLNCWGGLKQARALARAERWPRHAGFRCPSCRAAPPAGLLWACAGCGTRFDTFAAAGVCPRCGGAFAVTQCADCGESRPMAEWIVPPEPGAAVPAASR
jgi:Zn-dependent protease